MPTDKAMNTAMTMAITTAMIMDMTMAMAIAMALTDTMAICNSPKTPQRYDGGHLQILAA